VTSAPQDEPSDPGGATRPEDVVRRMWPDLPTSVEPLGGGITNRNFLVDVGGEHFVLRLPGRDTQLLGIDRAAEAAAARAAAAVGVGPAVEAFVEPEGYLVTRFVTGSPIPPERMREEATIVRVAAVLSRIHGAAPFPGRFDAHRVVEDYLETAMGRGVPRPDDFEWAHDLSSRIETARGAQPAVPCHNDLLNANFIEAEGTGDVVVVDWEYAGMGDRFFDLANFSVNHELEPEHDELLLRAYFGGVRRGDVASIALMRFMSDFREAMWGVVQQGISHLDFDFRDYAAKHFARMRDTAAAPAFTRSLDDLPAGDPGTSAFRP
jgi:thiamine kinase-like enzyme